MRVRVWVQVSVRVIFRFRVRVRVRVRVGRKGGVEVKGVGRGGRRIIEKCRVRLLSLNRGRSRLRIAGRVGKWE